MNKSLLQRFCSNLHCNDLVARHDIPATLLFRTGAAEAHYEAA